MNVASSILSLLAAHPETVQQFLNVEVDAAKTDSTLLPDLLKAATSGSYAAFALDHLAFILRVGGIVVANTELLGALGKALTVNQSE